MSQDVHIREQIEAAKTEIERLKAGGKLALASVEAQFASLRASAPP